MKLFPFPSGKQLRPHPLKGVSAPCYGELGVSTHIPGLHGKSSTTICVLKLRGASPSLPGLHGRPR